MKPKSKSTKKIIKDSKMPSTRKRKNRKNKRKNSEHPERNELEEIKRKLKLKYQKAAKSKLPVSDRNLDTGNGVVKNSAKYSSTIIRVETSLATKKQVTYVDAQLVDFLERWGCKPDPKYSETQPKSEVEVFPCAAPSQSKPKRAKKRKIQDDILPLSHASSEPVVCVICKKGDSAAECFGPYEFAPETVDPLYRPKTKLKAVQDEESSRFHGSGESVDVYIHEECALWSYKVRLDGVTLVGLDEELEESRNMLCELCKQPNAHLMCLAHRCPRSYHLPCAVEAGCQLRETRFGVVCDGCTETTG